MLPVTHTDRNRVVIVKGLACSVKEMVQVSRRAHVSLGLFFVLLLWIVSLEELTAKKISIKSRAKVKSGPKKKIMKSIVNDFSDSGEEKEDSEFNMLFQTKKQSGLMSTILRQSLFEQEIEDFNAIHRMQENLVRRLIVMPLSDSFKLIKVDAMHQKIQYGDKCSLPSSLGRYIFDHRLEVPWLFELKPISISPSSPKQKEENPHTDSSLISSFAPIRDPFRKKSFSIGNDGQIRKRDSSSTNEICDKYYERGKLNKVYISPLDFRSPENYIFLPKWVMNDLNLLPNDVVEISLVRIKLADLVVLQPVTADWDALMKETIDPKTLLEHEINKYSSLTSGATIFIKIKDKEYPIYVKETRAEGGIAVHGVRVQDSDIKTDIDRSVVDQLLLKQQQEQVQEQDKEEKARK